ncbi:MAG TPA: glycosyltransferase 87 family protein [Terracidiphilus sp.]|jgi:hypothetical protein|nr:glycosyltransferase 87 family protein [Terracidiphilus sp.]
MRIRSQRNSAAAVIVLGGAALLAAIFSLTLTEQSAATRDFIGYWAAGQQIVHGANPYNVDDVLQLEKSVGLGDLQIKITPSPPIGLALVLPLGFLSAKAGLVLWMMIELACFALSLAILWILQGRPDSRVHLFGFLFAPALACLMAGQLGMFLLLGLSLFLLWHETRPFWAGAALLPMTLKPHLFLPIAVVLLLWIVMRRRSSLIFGLMVAMAVSFASVLAFDAQVWKQYLAMLHAGLMQDRFAPTLSAYLRKDLAAHAVWLEYLPTALACIFALLYFWTRRARWDWLHHGQLVVVVGVLCAPYAWLTDEAVLLPAVLTGVYRALDLRRSLVPIAVFAGVALIELYANVRVTAWYYTWTTPAWLLWFLYAMRPADDSPQKERGPLSTR